jgi:integration host factor subunit beta
MTKSQLIEQISQRAPHVPRREVESIVNTVFDTMVDALRREERIEIRGFGSFAVKARDPREGRNPKTGQKVQVPRRRTPYFTVGKELKDRLNRQPLDGSAPTSTGQPLPEVGVVTVQESRSAGVPYTLR